MFFVELREALLNMLRIRVRNGELTERSLARLVGISQPHMHNVLKGVRTLSPEMLDRFLYQLRLSVLDLVDRRILERHISREQHITKYTYVPVVEGLLGPGQPWPAKTAPDERFPMPALAINAMHHPVIARLSRDAKMAPLFDEGDFVVLDQSHKARTEFDPEGLYAVKTGNTGVLRRIRIIDRTVYVVSEAALHRRDEWERLPVEGHHLAHFIRARATLVPREIEWE